MIKYDVEQKDGLVLRDNEVVGCKPWVTSVTIPAGVTEITDHAFRYCGSLTSIIIPPSVKQMGVYAFGGCPRLTDITCLRETPPNRTSISGKFFGFNSYCVLHVLPGCGSAYSIASQWEGFTIVEDAVMPDYRDLILAINTADAMLSFSTDGTYEWAWDDTGHRLWSTNKDLNSSTSQTTITINTSKPADFSFDYAVSSESGYDKLTITLDGTILVDAISGKSSSSKTCQLAPGTHIMVVKYVKDGSTSGNDDRAYVSNFRLEKVHKDYNLAYLVDGVCYAVLEYEEGSAITLPEPPTKDGYIFIGWDGLPEDMIMPDYALEVTAIYIRRGDSNHDKKVDLLDVEAIKKHILGVTPLPLKYGDINENGEICIADIAKVIEISKTPINVTSITLSETSFVLAIDETYTLTATIAPTYASNPEVIWASSNSDVVVVNESGEIMALGCGTATITCSATDGSGVVGTCVVTVPKPYEYVDLGLPSGIRWATCNMGADNPEDYGDYYAWGEFETKSNYKWSTYKWCKGSYDTQTKYCTSSLYGIVDKKTTLEPSDDVASVKWGGDWRMPTQEEFDELRDTNNCTWTWTRKGGKNGYLVTSRKNGNSIFLPAAGYRDGYSVSAEGSDAHYWSGSLGSNSDRSYYLGFGSSRVSLFSDSRYYGRSVRPVCPSPSSLVRVTTIILSKSRMEMIEGESSQLSATISPTNAMNKDVTWSSSNTDVATVSNTGFVTAKAIGSATITVTAADGSRKMSTCTVTVHTRGFKVINVHEYVDLGLPSGLKWATCNVGANSPEDYGDYYAWGETEPKSTYNWNNYKWCKGSYRSLTKYCTDSYYGTVDNKTTLDLEDDVAHVKWGGDWRMPTSVEMEELRDANNCTWTWTNQGGWNGYLVTSKKNGNSIFLPAAGQRDGSWLYYADSNGCYWSSSLSTAYSTQSSYLGIGSLSTSWSGTSRYRGQSVRPVCP